MSVNASSIDACSFAYLVRLVRERSAIVLDNSKAYLLESRLMPLARQLGMESLTSLVKSLEQPGSNDLAQQVVDAMTTNETSFFRDINPFDALRSEVLPELIQRRQQERTLNIWSNGCSSGQEIYSIAMLIREHFQPQLANWRVRLIATDLSSSMLKRAQLGDFNHTEVNRGLPLQLLLKYFEKRGMCWQIKEEIRRSVEFKEINLIERWPATLPTMDIVFLRNVLIYFDPTTKEQVLKRTRQQMRPDSYLFLGGSETTLKLDVPFHRQLIGKAPCYRPNVGDSPNDQ
jgi:chemotaxis protein methyltransferase CheR